jgi:hypothetical protein
VLIGEFTGMTHRLAGRKRALARELRRDSGSQNLPATLGAVIAVAEQTEGVHLGRLIAALQPDRQAAEDSLAAILREAASMEPEQPSPLQDFLREWEPVIAETAAAAAGDADAAARLAPRLDQLADNADWAALVGVLRRILDGDPSGDLLQGLDDIDTAIATEVLTRLSDPA